MSGRERHRAVYVDFLHSRSHRQKNMLIYDTKTTLLIIFLLVLLRQEKQHICHR